MAPSNSRSKLELVNVGTIIKNCLDPTDYPVAIYLVKKHLVATLQQVVKAMFVAPDDASTADKYKSVLNKSKTEILAKGRDQK